MAGILLSGCGSSADSTGSTVGTGSTGSEDPVTTVGPAVELGDKVTTTTAKRVEGAVTISGGTEPEQSASGGLESDPPAAETTTEAVTETTAIKTEPEGSVGSFSAKDAVVVLDSAAIRLNADFSDIRTSLGKPDEEYSSPSCLYDGDDKTFIYGGVTIYTYPSGGKDLVLEAEVSSGNAETPKGLKVGLSADEVTGLYGDGGYDGNYCEYKDGNTVLSVEFESGKVKRFSVFTK